jgi:hypothetical protein
MKCLLVLSVLVFVTLVSYGQTPNTVINCYVTNGRVDYGNLAKLLPDSMQTSLLIDPRKKFNMKDASNVVLWFEMQGWKIVGVAATSVYTTIWLTKGIYLDDTARALFLQKLENFQK